MAHGESSTAPLQNEQQQEQQQQIGRRTGFSYKHTPKIGSSSPRPEGGTDSNDDEEHVHDSDGFESDDVGPEQLLRRCSTMSKSYTAEEEKEVIAILDRRLVLFLAFLYLLSFLDRSNIGNARVAGLEESLSMSSAQFDLCLLGFYVTYITFEWMILLYRLVPAHIYIAGCVLAWGLVASLQSLVTNFKQLLGLRALLGVTEAAFGPGVPFYMTFFYRRSELAYRVGLQISAAPLATCFASGLAWVIVQVAPYVGLDRWRALFLIEGFPSVVAAIVAWYWIPDSPATAPWLNPRQRKIAALRLQTEGSEASSSNDISSSSKKDGIATGRYGSKLDLSELWTTIRDPKSYLTALMFLSVNVSFASLPVFLPTVINSMSFSPLTSQILSAPPYLIAFVFVMYIGHHSDKKPDSRSLFLCGVALLSCLSYTTIAVAGSLHDILGDRISIGLRYMAIYPAAMGLFSSVVLIITWTLNNQQSSTGKGTGMVILNLVGQCGPLIGVKLFPKSSEPLYISGMVVCAGFMGGVAVLALVLRRYLIWLNDRNGDSGKGSYEMVGLNDRNEIYAHEMDNLEDDVMKNDMIRRNDGQFRFML